MLYKAVIEEQFYWGEKPIESAIFFAELEKETTFVAQCLASQSLHGFISFSVAERFIHSLYVRVDSQKKGIGTRLLNHAVETIGKPVFLKCNASNLKSQAFYIRHGWHIVRHGIQQGKPYYLMTTD